ncbi:MAG TPA: hypothetical protein VM324_14560, partial [Egibacteraceae bacterium]|nr:hypothetical protein [Egibacteraceae bacterium]
PVDPAPQATPAPEPGPAPGTGTAPEVTAEPAPTPAPAPAPGPGGAADRDVALTEPDDGALPHTGGPPLWLAAALLAGGGLVRRQLAHRPGGKR